MEAWPGLETLRTLQFANSSLSAGPLPADWPDSLPQLSLLQIQYTELNATLPASEPQACCCAAHVPQLCHSSMLQGLLPSTIHPVRL